MAREALEALTALALRCFSEMLCSWSKREISSGSGLGAIGSHWEPWIFQNFESQLPGPTAPPAWLEFLDALLDLPSPMLPSAASPIAQHQPASIRVGFLRVCCAVHTRVPRAQWCSALRYISFANRGHKKIVNEINHQSNSNIELSDLATR